MLYFKVKQVCGFSAEEESYLADSSHTSLYMVRNKETIMGILITQNLLCHIIQLIYAGVFKL